MSTNKALQTESQCFTISVCAEKKTKNKNKKQQQKQQHFFPEKKKTGLTRVVRVKIEKNKYFET